MTSCPTKSLESLLKTVDDAAPVRGCNELPASSKTYKMITKGHKNYTNSFKSKKS